MEIPLICVAVVFAIIGAHHWFFADIDRMMDAQAEPEPPRPTLPVARVVRR